MTKVKVYTFNSEDLYDIGKTDFFGRPWNPKDWEELDFSGCAFLEAANPVKEIE